MKVGDILIMQEVGVRRSLRWLDGSEKTELFNGS